MKIAITGGIGTGKSSVIEHLKPLMKDYIFCNVDAVVEESYKHENITAFLKMLGISSKKEMSDIFFDNPAIKTRFESLINPIIGSSIKSWLNLKNVIIEFPLLFRPDFKEYLDQFDLIISITAPTDIRIARVRERNKSFSLTKIEKIMSLQPEQEYVDVQSDIVFENNVPPNKLGTAVDNLYAIIKQKDIAKEAKVQSSKILDGLRTRPQGKTGLIPGSFDPIQRGHLYVIQKALSLVDTVRVVVGYNDKKNPYLTNAEKSEAIKESILEILGPEAMTRIRVDFLSQDDLLITHAQKHDAKFIFRGLRSGFDFDYEHSINAAQRDIDSSIETIYIMTPNELTQVSSSLVKTLHRYPDAHIAVKKYVTNAVLKILNRKVSAESEDL